MDAIKFGDFTPVIRLKRVKLTSRFFIRKPCRPYRTILQRDTRESLVFDCIRVCVFRRLKTTHLYTQTLTHLLLPRPDDEIRDERFGQHGPNQLHDLPPVVGRVVAHVRQNVEQRTFVG